MNKLILKTLPELLDQNRIDLLEKLLPFCSNFVLAGGTALALQIKHRKSFDYDFFTGNYLPNNFSASIAKKIKISKIEVNTRDEFTFFDSNQIKVTFFHYPFPKIFELINVKPNLNLYGIKEISIHKAYVLGRRGAYRDYFDLYTLFSQHYVDFTDLISQAEKVYEGLFSKKLFFEQLTYFGDILDFDIIPFNDKQLLPKPDQIQTFFENLVRKEIEN